LAAAQAAFPENCAPQPSWGAEAGRRSRALIPAPRRCWWSPRRRSGGDLCAAQVPVALAAAARL